MLLTSRNLDFACNHVQGYSETYQMGSGRAELEGGVAELKASVGREGAGNTPDGVWPGGQGKQGSGLRKLLMSAAPGGGRTDPKDSLAGSTIPSAVRLSDHMWEQCQQGGAAPGPEGNQTQRERTPQMSETAPGSQSRGSAMASVPPRVAAAQRRAGQRQPRRGREALLPSLWRLS